MPVGNRPAAPALTLTTASGQITAAWTAPADGGSAVTGYVLQYKLDTAADTEYTAVTLATPTSLSAVVTGLTDGADYDVRVRAANAAGSGPWADGTARPGAAVDNTAPVLQAATVAADGSTISLDFDDTLDTALPAASAFAITVGGAAPANPSAVALDTGDSSILVLTMGAAIAAGDTVSVAYTAPSANPLQNASGTDVADATWAVLNRPAAPGARPHPRPRPDHRRLGGPRRRRLAGHRLRPGVQARHR